MSDLISRQALLDWINKQREDITKKQVAGTDGSIFTREALVTMQRCISTFETAINNQPTAYDVEKVVKELETEQNKLDTDMWAKENDNWYGQYCNGVSEGIEKAIEVVKGG